MGKNFPIYIPYFLILSLILIGYSQNETIKSNPQAAQINSNWIISYDTGLKRYFFFTEGRTYFHGDAEFYPIQFSPYFGVEFKRRFYLSNYFNLRYTYWSGRREYPEWVIIDYEIYRDSTALRQEYIFFFGYSHSFTITNHLQLWVSEETMISYTKQQYFPSDFFSQSMIYKEWLWAFSERLGLSYSLRMFSIGFEAGYAPAPALLSLVWDYFDKNSYTVHNISLGTKVFIRF